MSWFKRLCLFVFGVCGILALGALSLTWVGPWTTQLRGMLELRWFFITLEVLVCVSGAGFVICLLLSLFAPRNPKETVVAEVAGGQITVSRTAISSQTKHIVEADGTCIASAVSVRVRKRGNVRVHVRVKPRRPMDVIVRGEELYAQLAEGLSHVCGDTVQSIDVVFTEPEQMDDSLIRVETTDESEARASEPTVAEDITVPMTASASVVSAEAAEQPAGEPEVPAAAEPQEAEPQETEAQEAEPQEAEPAQPTPSLSVAEGV